MVYKRTQREDVFQGKILNVVRDTVETPSNKVLKREIVLHPGAAGIIPVDEDGNIFLVKQYRHPVGEEIFEIPAGCLEKGEEPKVCAIREVEEEIGYKATDMDYLMTIYPAVGFSSEIITIYVGTGLVKTEQNLDDDEEVEIFRFSLEQIMDMIAKGEIRDSKTICAILAYNNNVNK